MDTKGLDSLLDQHFTEYQTKVDVPDMQDIPSLDSLLGAYEVQTGKREKTWGETMSDSIQTSLLNASRILPGLWQQVGATGQETVRRLQFGTGYDAGGEERPFIPVEAAAAAVYAGPARIVPKRFWAKPFRDRYEEYAKKNPLALDVQNSFANKVFRAPAQWTTKQVDGIIERNPHLASEPSNFMELLTNPRKLAGAVVESLPVLASAGFLTYAGQAPLAFALMFAAEGQEAHDTALADGRTEDEASEAYNLYGLTAAAIETVQIGQGLKLLKGQKKALLNRVAQLAGKESAEEGVKYLTPKWFKTAIAVSLEEMSQGQVGEWTSKAVYGKEQPGGFTDWLDRRATEGLVAFGISLPLGVSAVGVDVTGGYVKRKAQDISANVKSIDSAKEAIGFTDEDFEVPNALGRRHQGIESFVSRVFGKKVAWYVPRTERASAFNGWAHPTDTDTILLNAESIDPLQSVSMHEITHQLERSDPEGYGKLKETVFKYLRSSDMLFEEIRGKFTRMGLDINNPELESETVAEVIGRLSLEQQFLDEVAGDQPTVLAKIGRYAGRFARTAAARFKGKKARIQQAEETQWIDAYITDMQTLSDRIAETLRNLTGEAAPVTPEAVSPQTPAQTAPEAQTQPQAAPEPLEQRRRTENEYFTDLLLEERQRIADEIAEFSEQFNEETLTKDYGPRIAELDRDLRRRGYNPSALPTIRELVGLPDKTRQRKPEPVKKEPAKEEVVKEEPVKEEPVSEKPPVIARAKPAKSKAKDMLPAKQELALAKQKADLAKPTAVQLFQHLSDASRHKEMTEVEYNRLKKLVNQLSDAEELAAKPKLTKQEKADLALAPKAERVSFEIDKYRPGAMKTRQEAALAERTAERLPAALSATTKEQKDIELRKLEERAMLIGRTDRLPPVEGMRRFLLALRGRNVSPETAKSYSRVLKSFLGYTNSIGITDLNDVTPEHARTYLQGLGRKGSKASTVGHALTVLNGMFNQLVGDKALGVNPFATIDQPKMAPTLPKAVSRETVQKILRQIGPEETHALRDKALILFMLNTGARASEAAGATETAIDTVGQTGKVTGKGAKERMVVMDKETAEAIDAYVQQERGKMKNAAATPALFLSRSGKPLDRTAIAKIVKKYADRAGVEVSPHILRHTFATGLLKGGMDLISLQQLMGHESVTTTANYLKVDIAHLKEAMKHHPRPSIAKLPSLQQRLAAGLKPTNNINDLLLQRAGTEAWGLDALKRVAKGWILGDGDFLPVKIVSIGRNKTWEHFDHAMTAKSGLNGVFESGAFRIARLPFSTNEIVIEGNAEAINQMVQDAMSSFAEQGFNPDKNNMVRMELHRGNKRGFATVPITDIGSVRESIDEAIKDAKRDLVGLPSISKKGSRMYVAGQQAKTLKQAIQAGTGITAKAHPKPVTQEAALKLRLKAEERAAKMAYREGLGTAKNKIMEFKAKVKQMAEFRKLYRQWVRKDLPMELRGKMLGALDSIKTERSFDKAIAKLVAEIDNMVRRQELARLKKFLSDFRKKYGRPKRGISAEGAEYKIAPEFSAIFEKVLDSITTKKPLEEEGRMDLEELIAYAQQEKAAAEAEGLTYDPFLQNEIIPALENFQRQLARQSVRVWDPEFLRDFTDSLMTLLAQWEFQRSEEYQKERQQWEVDKFNIIGEVLTNHKKIIPEGERDVQNASSPYRIKRAWLGIFGRYNYNLQTLANIVSGMKYGTLYTRLADDITAGRDVEKQMAFVASDETRRMMAEYGITTEDLMRWSRMFQPRKWSLGKDAEAWISKHTPDVLVGRVEHAEMEVITIKTEGGQTISMNVAEALDIIMHTRNTYNYKTLLESGIVFRDKPLTTYKLTPLDIDAIWKALPEKAQKVKNIVDHIVAYQQEQVNRASRRLVGYNLANRTGYWHIRRHKPGGVVGKKMEFTQETIESRSHWKEIVGGKDPLIIGDVFNNLVESVQVASEYVGLAEPMRKAGMVLKDKDITKKVYQKGYSDYWHDIKKLLSRVQERNTDAEWYDRWYNKWMRNVTRAIFAFNPRLAIQQWFSVFLACNELGHKPIKFIRGLPDKKLQARIEELSPFLRERFTGKIGREMGEVAQVGSVARFFTQQDVLVNLPTHMVTYFDKLAILDVWRMVEGSIAEKAKYAGMTLDELYKRDDFQFEVVKRAEETIRISQPTWDVTDRSLIGSTRNPWAKAATMFHSQREKLVQMLGMANSRYMNTLNDIRRRNKLSSLGEAARTDEGKKATVRVVEEYSVVLVNTALVKGWGILYGVYILNRDDDWKDWVAGILADIPGMFYFGDIARDVILSWHRIAEGEKTYQLGAMEYPPMRVLTETRLAVYEMGVLIMMLSGMKDATDYEIEEQVQATIKRLWSALNYAAGAPFEHLGAVTKAWTSDEYD